MIKERGEKSEKDMGEISLKMKWNGGKKERNGKMEKKMGWRGGERIEAGVRAES